APGRAHDVRRARARRTAAGARRRRRDRGAPADRTARTAARAFARGERVGGGVVKDRQIRAKSPVLALLPRSFSRTKHRSGSIAGRRRGAGSEEADAQAVRLSAMPFWSEDADRSG